MEALVYELIENAALFISLGLFFVGFLILQAVVSAAAQKRNSQFQKALMDEEAKKTAALREQAVLIERQTVALEKIAAAIGRNGGNV